MIQARIDVGAPPALQTNPDVGYGVIDWCQSAASILLHNHNLGCSKDPATRRSAKVFLASQFIVAHRLRISGHAYATRSAKPGELLAILPNALIVATADSPLELTALTSLDGTPFDTSLHNLSVGHRLPTFPADRHRGLTRQAAALQTSEHFWISHLQQLPAESTDALPMSTSPRRSLHVSLPSAWRASRCAPGGTRHENILAALMMLVTRVKGATRPEMWWSGPRTRAAAADGEGCFATAVPLHPPLEASQRLDALTRHLTQSVQQCEQHGTYALDLMPRWVGLPQRSPAAGAVCFGQLGNSTATPEYSEHDAFDWQFYLQDDGQSVRIVGHAHDAETALFFDPSQLDAILAHIIAQPERALSDIDLVDAAQRQRLLNDFNPRPTPYPDTPLATLFSRAARRVAHKVAVEDAAGTLTYAQLDARSTALAQHLQAAGIGRGSAVGIAAQRSTESITALLAVLKAHAAYVPIDPAYPPARVAYMVEDSGITALVTSNHGWARETGFRGIIVDPTDSVMPPGQPPGALTDPAQPTDLAYILYTSGTTGKPKGVCVEHHNVLNLFHWFSRTYNLSDNDHVLSLASLSFDVSVEEIIVSLLAGASVYLPSQEIYLDPDKFAAYVQRKNITIAQFVPSTLRALLAQGPYLDTLRVVICGGEKLDSSLRDQILNRGYALYNHYGPTETTVDCVATRCEHGVDTIGRPIANNRAYVLDGGHRLVPPGIVGDLYIAGAGVARGYHHAKELSLSRFLPDPFAPGARMYRTGDRARWLQDGQLEFLGRDDDQVKIRGRRISLLEIRATLLAQSGINDCSVTLHACPSGDPEIAAYLVTDGETHISSLRMQLGAFLPPFMLPTFFVRVPKLPLGPNGKVDTRALPAPTAADRAEPTLTPVYKNEDEAALGNIWCAVLDTPRISPTANFFSLGGHSMQVAKLASLVDQRFGVRMSLGQFFTMPTIREQAQHIRRSGGKVATSRFEKVEKKPYYPATPLQRTVYEAALNSHDSPAYNVVWGAKVQGCLDVVKLREATLQLVQRHDLLRAQFHEASHGLEYRVRTVTEAPFAYFDLSKQPELFTVALRGSVNQLDLRHDTLFRVLLFRLSNDAAVLVLHSHYAVVDGISMTTLRNELLALYRGEALRPIPVRFADYGAWLDNKRMAHDYQKTASFWSARVPRQRPALARRLYARSLHARHICDAVVRGGQPRGP